MTNIKILNRNRTVFLILALVAFSIAIFYIVANPKLVEEFSNHMTQIIQGYSDSEPPTNGYNAGIIFVLSMYFFMFLPSIVGVLFGIIFTCISIVNNVKYKKALREGYPLINSNVNKKNGGTL